MGIRCGCLGFIGFIFGFILLALVGFVGLDVDVLALFSSAGEYDYIVGGVFTHPRPGAASYESRSPK